MQRMRAAGQRRLQQVGRVHRPTAGRTRADHRVDFVDEQHRALGCVLQLGHHGLQALLEIAAVARAGQQRAHIQRVDRRSWRALRARRLPRFAWPGPRRSPSCPRRGRPRKAGCSWCAGTGSGSCAQPRWSRPISGSILPDMRLLVEVDAVGGRARPGCGRRGFSSRSCSGVSGVLALLLAVIACWRVPGAAWQRPGALAMPWLMKLTASSRVMSCICRKYTAWLSRSLNSATSTLAPDTSSRPELCT